ncbi:STAS/SEC14 domain-containing protein [Hymenobacter coccineus]|uniref:STAS/SEC14 domain-containing protein n=1 Tax=Hymenobacter coccineus TaxID=1908235 RepID=A0A1G1THJ1_9BACT|nr:STAS/SEC14 domain-containing protein [Hymenobacter coccineus]OGX90337.1 hypothetical protein BEN49_23150 [Hymenobacter coccineus]
MRLHLIRKTDCVSIYYDSLNEWLFLDWEGELTLLDVQTACLEVARCFLPRPYARVLNSNEQVTGVSWSVAAWLARDFLPHLTVAGITHIAWVYSSSVRARHVVQTVLNWLPGPALTSFDDLDAAVTWLQHIRPEGPAQASLRLPATQAKLDKVFQDMCQKVKAQVPTH